MPGKTKKAARVPSGSPPPVSDRSKLITKLTKSIDGFKLWKDIEHPLILPTSFSSFNRAMRCGGIPGGMMGVIHGPSQGGKTVALSTFLRDVVVNTGGLSLFIDAECRGVDLKWFEVICGDLADIIYYKPKTFEEFIKKIADFRAFFRQAKADGDLPETAMCAIGVDSLNRLTPKDELDEVLKGKAEGRKYPLRAMFIASWLDGIIPTLENDESPMVILREGVNMEAMPGQKKYKVKGGNAPGYDAGWVCRITARNKVKVRRAGEKSDLVIGEKHEIHLMKNSMGPKDEALASFYTSLGAEGGTPLGLDPVREVRDEAIESGYAVHRKRKGGTGYYVGDDLVAADKPKFLRWLVEETEGGRFRWEEVRDALSAKLVESK